MKKRLLSLILATILTLSICIMNDITTYAMPQDIHNTYDSKEHTISEVKEKWNELKPTYNGSAYDVTPSTVTPYSEGKLNEQYLNDCINYMNFIRYLADLSNVSLNDELTSKAQYGAVLLASSNFSHNPLKPNNMSEDFYEKGVSVTDSSNIVDGTSSVISGINICLNDSTNTLGYGNIGHRLHLLNPNINNISFGVAGFRTLQYIDMDEMVKFYEDDGKTLRKKNDRPECTTWPSKGAFPKSLMSGSQLWNATFDTTVYNVHSLENATVKVTRISDNKVWNLSKLISFSNPSQTGFTIGYSDIYFHISSQDLGQSNYDGKYKVEINGVQKINENNTSSYTYTVDFFDL